MVWHPPQIMLYQKTGTPKISLPQGPSVIDIIKRETGETTWSGENFGLIGSDGQKLYVYHTPAMQQRIGEIVGRFLRPETQNIQFSVQYRYITVSSRYLEETGSSIDKALFGTFNRLQPILTPEGKPVCKKPGSKAFWVAKEDIPDFEKQSARFDDQVTGQSNTLQSPNLTTRNGQFGAIMDVTSSEFVTDMVQGQPVKTAYCEGQAMTAFSLLSWDGKTVTTDISAEFSKITRVDKAVTIIGEPSAEQTAQIPTLAKETFSEQEIVWSADGMLVMVYGTNRIAEGHVRKKGLLPFMNQPVGREICHLYCIVTAKMRNPAEKPLTSK